MITINYNPHVSYNKITSYCVNANVVNKVTTIETKAKTNYIVLLLSMQLKTL